MRARSWTAVAISLIGSFASSGSVASGGESVATTLDRYLSARTELGQFSGAALVAQRGRIILRKGYGFADVAQRIPYRPDTQHEVASISKMFTALAALQLRDRGKLTLDDPICDYFSDCPDAWRAVTIRHLIRHRSGMPDYEERVELGSEKYLELMKPADASARILARAKTDPLEFPPGSKFHYSNTGYIVLGFVLEKAGGVPFAQLVTESILKPAGMRSSGVLGTGSRPRRLAVGYSFGDIGWKSVLRGTALTAGHLRPVAELALTPPQGDAWLYSTVDDLYRFSRLMEGSELVPAPLVSEIATADEGGYGAGWFIDNGFERKRMRHNGSMPGYVSDFIRFPDDKTTIILFSNVDRTRMSRVARDVTAIVLGRSFDMPVHGEVIELSAEQISGLVGDYVMADGKALNVRNEPDYLTAELAGQYTAGLIPLSPTEMYFPLGDGRAIFTRDAAGRAVAVNMRYGGEDHVAKRAPAPTPPEPPRLDQPGGSP